MKIALVITEGLRQIALTPQSKDEIQILETLTTKGWSLDIKRGQFFVCQGGYARIGTEVREPDSVMLVLRQVETSPQSIAQAAE